MIGAGQAGPIAVTTQMHDDGYARGTTRLRQLWLAGSHHSEGLAHILDAHVQPGCIGSHHGDRVDEVAADARQEVEDWLSPCDHFAI